MYHLQITRVSRSVPDAAIERLNYVGRTGRYARRGDKLRLLTSINLPAWSGGVAEVFWKKVDQSKMRINARLLFTVEVAIPRQLSVGDQTSLVEGFARLLSRMSTGRRDKTNMPLTFAIHEGVRSDDNVTGRLPNPHSHFLCSSSINDLVARPIKQWFLKANSRNPQSGGAPRSAYIGTKRWLQKVRRVWERMANSALRKAGFSATLDHRSHRARGLLSAPSIHLGPTASYLERHGKPTERSERNAKIKRENEQIEEGHRNYKRQQRQVEEAVEESRVCGETDLARQDAITLELGRILGAHPFAVEASSIRASASALLYTRDVKSLPDGVDSAKFLHALRQLQQALGNDWLTVVREDRVWLLHPPSDDVLMLASGLIVTDSHDPVFLRAVGLAAKAIDLADLAGLAAEEVRTLLEKTLEQLNVVCRWEGTLRLQSDRGSMRLIPPF